MPAAISVIAAQEQEYRPIGYASSFESRVAIAAVKAAKAITRVFGRRGVLLRALVAQEFAPIVTSTTPFGAVRFYCPGTLPVWRARTLLNKEPETIEWIDSFSANSVLWDIGANVGAYSLYAGLKRHTVLAFEPAFHNYYALNKNIEINDMAEQVWGLCVALYDRNVLDSFYINATAIGSADHNFFDPVDWRGLTYRPGLRQGMIGITIDNFISMFMPPFPNYMKIDVDGAEEKIIDGAQKTLTDSRLRSVLIELNTNRPAAAQSTIEKLEHAGFRLTTRRHAPMFDGSAYSSIYNHIFTRS